MNAVELFLILSHVETHSQNIIYLFLFLPKPPSHLTLSVMYRTPPSQKMIALCHEYMMLKHTKKKRRKKMIKECESNDVKIRCLCTAICTSSESLVETPTSGVQFYVPLFFRSSINCIIRRRSFEVYELRSPTLLSKLI